MSDLINLDFVEDENVRRYETMIIEDFIKRNPDFDINVILEKRKTGIPLAYVLNEAYFFDHIFYVDENVLIPRSETELVVEQALNKLNTETKKVLDVGTGSGSIAITIASKFPNVNVFACDISNTALVVAKKNAQNISVENITFIESDLFENIDRSLLNSFDLIISNPPYIGEDELDGVDESVKKFEPHLALFADDDGFAIYKQLIEQSKHWLKPGGYLVLEIAPRHYKKIFDELQNNQYGDIEIKNDYNDRARIAIAKN